MKFFDTHCHLQDDRIAGSVETIVGRAIDNGVRRMVCCGSVEADWQAVLDIAGRFPSEVVPAFGLHPWYIGARNDLWCGTLSRLLEENPTAAVGEIGLDHALPKRDDTAQMKVFYEQLRLARQFGRPASIHCRSAWGALMELVRREPGIVRQSVIHSYSGPPELLSELERSGISISFSGSITYDRNKRGRRSVAQVSLRHLLIESDSPDISPVNHPPPNEPATLFAVAREIAALRGTCIEEIAEATWINGDRLFGRSSTAVP